MDLISLAKINGILRDGGAGYTFGKTYKAEWDISMGIEGRPSIGGGSVNDDVIFISELVPDMEDIKNGTIEMEAQGQKATFPISMLSVRENGPYAYNIEDSGMVIALVVKSVISADAPVGIYVNERFLQGTYVAIFWDEKTVHPIDPKYIPTLDYLTLNGADGKQYKVTVNESGVLTATEVG